MNLPSPPGSDFFRLEAHAGKGGEFGTDFSIPLSCALTISKTTASQQLLTAPVWEGEEGEVRE